MKAHTSLQSVKTHLTKIQNVVAAGESGAVDIAALPARITDLLARTQINITAPTGASLPLERHGLGTQSLSVIFLFEAFLETVLAKQYDELSEPILTLEEPEAHLHPWATRSLWTALDAIRGQKIIATHSGDLLSRVPLGSIRRFCRENGNVVIKQLRKGTLEPDDQRKIEFHLLNSRSELLFARCWLLVEGESEYWLFTGVADILDHHFDRLGIRVVNTRLSGVEPLVKVANDFGIAWSFVGDGDQQGQKDKAACEKYVKAQEIPQRLTVLNQPNIEVFLCENGFGHVFEAHISDQKKHLMTAKKGARKYWEQVVEAQPNKHKPAIIHEVLAEMKSKGKKSVPEELKRIAQAAASLAER